MEEIIESFQNKMKSAKLDDNVIATFINYYKMLVSGSTGKLTNDTIDTVNRYNLINYNGLSHQDENLINSLVVIKLNGGLGTSMGLNKAKSLLPVKGDLSFIDILAKQNLSLREKFSAQIPLIFMNSYNTNSDTLKALEKYPKLAVDNIDIAFVQNKYPRILKNNFTPTEFEDDNQNWNPPGHGDIYSALFSQGILTALLKKGIKYAFISNADNLGAVADLKILTYMKQNNIPFIMEVCERTEMDKKGGHLAQTKESGRLILREVAQCPENEISEFQDINKYCYFNTNNLWVNLEVLAEILEKNDNIINLPLIVNPKTVNNQEVIQIETAMGAAINIFEGSKAIVVPRSRFVPVKRTNDLLVLWSDVYKINSDYQVVTVDGVTKPPTVVLDDRFYKTVEQLKSHFKQVPSLIQCNKLEVSGNLYFSDNVSVIGDVTLTANEKDRVANTEFDNKKIIIN